MIAGQQQRRYRRQVGPGRERHHRGRRPLLTRHHNSGAGRSGPVGGGVEPAISPDGLRARLHGAGRGRGLIRVTHHLLQLRALQRAGAGAREEISTSR